MDEFQGDCELAEAGGQVLYELTFISFHQFFQAGLCSIFPPLKLRTIGEMISSVLEDGV